MTAATTTQPKAVFVKPGTPSVLKLVQTVDTKTALTRALREYLEPLEVTEPNGRTLKLLKVYDVWAEPEDVGKFPSVSINPLGELEYDSADMNNRLEEIAPNIALRRWANAKLQIQLQAWSNDPEERLMLGWMLENAMNPETHGLFLDVPYYFNARARFTPTSSMHEDDGESAQKRWRKFSMTVSAEIGAYVPVGKIPYLIPRAGVTVDS
jgi:hypothetical protein